MSRRKKQEPVHSTFDLGQGFELTFITGVNETVCICEPLLYDKLVARHHSCKDLQEMHESLSYLFPQYIKDAKRHIP